MTPSRAKQASDTPKARHRPYSTHLRNDHAQDALPGVQKLKASLRQARRLLAKANLAADVQVQTERRVKALEADLVKAEHARRERAMAAKYHKVKFFERQKVVRKIKQAKRSLAAANGEERKRLETTLAGLRVDLNYILHYPKIKKYISLFPPEVRESNGLPPAPVKANDDERSQVQRLIRSRMECGELSLEPENELEKPQWERKPRSKHDSGIDGGGSSKKTLKPAELSSGDEFFENDGDEEENSEPPSSDSN